MFESIFNPDNPLMCTINKIIDLVVLSLLWTLCSLPIITIGASSSALYHAIVKSVRKERSHATKEFFHSFKTCLPQSILFMLIWCVFAFMMLVSDIPLAITFLDTGKIQNVFLLVLFAVKAMILLGTGCWFFPLLSRYRQSFLQLLKATLYLLSRHFIISLLAVIFLIIMVAVLIAEPLLLAVVPGVAVYLVSFFLEPGLRELCEDPTEQGKEDTWYLG